jgi:hypothetical protein
MPALQSDSRGRKNLKTGAGERRRFPWGTILLGAALLACALALYQYASSNTPHTLRAPPEDLDNINRSASRGGAESPRPTPSATATPSQTPEPKSGARNTR